MRGNNPSANPLTESIYGSAGFVTIREKERAVEEANIRHLGQACQD
jgi:hypothetical protein